MPRITVEIRGGLATVVTKKLRLPKSHSLRRRSSIEVEVLDYDIEGGVYGPQVIRRGYARRITEIGVEYNR